MLVKERHRGVSKSELLDGIWAGTAVTENTLTQRIKELRDALGDSAQEPVYLRTIARVGYQFVGTVIEETDVPAPAAQAVPQPDAASVRPAAQWIAGLILVVTVITVAVLFAISRRGSGPNPRHQLVSTFQGSHASPTLSPDARMVAFVMDVNGVPQLFVATIGAGTPLQITTGDVPVARPRWSPRGDQIVFERRVDGIWSVPPLGGQPRRLIEHGASPNFSADGNTIVFERGPNSTRSTRWSVWLADANGGNPRVVEGTPDKVFWNERSSPALSADGTMIAFFRQSAGPNGDLWVVNAAGGGARQLTRDEREGGAPAWTADSRAIIFPSARRGSRTLWRIGLDGTTSQVTTGAGDDDEPDVSADGRRVMYVNHRNRSALKLVAPQGTTTTLIEGPAHQWLPHVSPDGRRLAYFADVNGDMHIFTMQIDGTGISQITHGERRQNIHPSWSHDGQALYFYGRAIGGSDPDPAWRRVDISGEHETTVVKGWAWATHNNAHVDPSGAAVLYTRVGADTGDYSRDTTYIRDLQSGAERGLPGPHMHGAQWSPDGRRIAGHRHDGSIALCDAASGQCEKAGEGTQAQWCSDGGHLYFQRRVTPKRISILRLDLESRREEAVVDLGPLHPLAATFSVTPDHRIVFTEFSEGRGELWLMDIP